jgi:hypothetical protein
VLDGVIPQDHLSKFLLQRSRRSKRIPTVLSRDEVRRVIDAIDHVMNKPSIAVTSPLDHLADSPARAPVQL